MTQEHLFAPYIRILGKGKKGSRSLTQTEARNAFAMVLRDEIEPEQLGAFLMLLRIKEETGEEVAGFVEAVREQLDIPRDMPSVDLDWSTYAGKRRHLPWFILATLALANSGIRVFMHGASGHTAGRLYTREVLEALKLPVAKNWAEVSNQLEQHNFSYLGLEHLSPVLHKIIELRPILGLRSPVHTLARQLNPLHAPCSMQSIFHPGYQAIHQEAELLLNQPRMAVIKGDGGEVECNPDADSTAFTVIDGVAEEECWPALFSQRHVKPTELNLQDLVSVWRGEKKDEYAHGAIIMTMAITLKTQGKAETQAQALTLAESLWQQRSVDRI